MQKRYILFLSVFICLFSYAQRLPLPTSLIHKSIWYESAEQISKWSCGYNVLYNACRAEQMFGNGSSYHFIDDFKRQCLTYLTPRNVSTDDSSTNKQLEDLAKLFKLPCFTYLTLENGLVNVVTSELLKVKYLPNTSQKLINQLFNDEANKLTKKEIKNLKEKFKKVPKGKALCLHFACHTEDQGGPHVILITLVKNTLDHTFLYINDNTNDRIYENSESKKYIDYLCDQFELD